MADGIHESLPSWKFIGGFSTFTGLEENPDDDGANGHGTFVAGIALGTGGPSGTFRGIAPGAGLIDIQVTNPNWVRTGPLANVIAGIDKCIERREEWGIHVAYLGLAVQAKVPFPARPIGASNGLDSVSQAVNRAVQEGIVMVVASVDDSIEPDPGSVMSPGAADLAISVDGSSTAGTIDRSDDFVGAPHGPRPDDGDSDPTDELKPDVSAPYRATSAFEGYGDYIEQTGQSVAAAHVAGLAALILQAEPILRPLEVKQRIIDSAEDFGEPGWDVEWGHGLVDGYNAVNNIAGGRGGPCTPTDLRAASIAAENPHIVAGIPNALLASVCNDGPADAGPFRVRLSSYLLSDSSGNYPVCTVEVPGLGAGDCTHVRCDWTPRVSGTGVVHACVKAEVVYSCDTDSSNHYIQANLSIETSNTTSEFAMQAVNPAAEDLTMEILPRFSPACGGWSFSQSDPRFFMAVAQCGRVVNFSLTPGPGTTASCRVDVAVEGVRPDGSRLSFPGVTLLGAVPEPDRPLCVLSGTGTDERGRKMITIKAQDTKSGLAGINVVKWQNSSVRLPVLEPGGTGAVYVTSTKLDQNLSSSTELDVIDAAGNVRRCDPLHVVLDRQNGKPVTETFTGIPQAERYLSVHNGSPGVTNLSVEVNGKKFQLGGLKPGEVRERDLGSAMVARNGNTVSFTVQGKPGGEVVVLLHD